MIISVPWLTTFSSLTYLPTYTWFVLRRNFVTGDSLPCSQDVLIINQRLIAHASIYTHSLSFSQTNSHIILSQKRERGFGLVFVFVAVVCCYFDFGVRVMSRLRKKHRERERERVSVITDCDSDTPTYSADTPTSEKNKTISFVASFGRSGLF